MNTATCNCPGCNQLGVSLETAYFRYAKSWTHPTWIKNEMLKDDIKKEQRDMLYGAIFALLSILACAISFHEIFLSPTGSESHNVLLWLHITLIVIGFYVLMFIRPRMLKVDARREAIELSVDHMKNKISYCHRCELIYSVEGYAYKADRDGLIQLIRRESQLIQNFER